ncbi:MAG: response regulator [Anaerolineaceae bacterium]
MVKKILVIDDEIAMRKLITATLMRAGYVVEQASTIKEATERLSQNDFDLITCDFYLPEMNAAEFISQLKMDSTQFYPKILIISGVDLNEMNQQSAADDYLSKPFRLQELKEKTMFLIGAP